jgi:cytosine/adenosine deaminase-related metal-dependent hydrolase
MVGEVTCHKARLIMQAPGRWRSGGFVAVSQGRIVEVGALGKKPPCSKMLDHGPGILMPALVNAHTHLTLSALHGRIETSKGFLAWVESLIKDRSELSLQEALRSTREAARTLRETGTGLVGEFGPFFPVEEHLAFAGLEGVVWQEFLGEGRDLTAPSQTFGGIVSSLAGHAPHTTSPKLLKKIKTLCLQWDLPFSLHLAESQEEVEFLQSGQGEWARFLESRHFSFKDWDCFGLSPVSLAQRLGLLDPKTLLVHLIHVSPKEVELLAQSGVGVCVCPRSNWKLHQALPRLMEFLKAGLKPALGTDSLASVDSLSLFEEMQFTARNYPDLKPREILRMATANGARALWRQDLGLLEKGRSARMIYVELDAADPWRAEERLVSEPPALVKPVGW